MYVVDVIEKWAFLKEVDYGLKINSFLRKISNLFVNVFDDLLLFDFE